MADIKMLHAKAEVVRQNVQVEEGVIDAVVGSTNVLDRMGDVISQDGWDLESYKSNPVILWGHNVKEERPPIGKALKVWLEGKQERSKKLMFKVKFDLQDSFASEVFRKIKDGFVNTVSVGFLPIEWEELDKDAGPFGGRKYTRQELLELSFVPVPANPEAVVALRNMKDKRFTPEKLEDMYPQVDKSTEETAEGIKSDEVLKPYPNEHACRLENPDKFEDNSFRRMKRKHEGKEYSVIMGKIKGEDNMTDQAYRYAKDTWDASTAKAHCKAHNGTFEAATEAQEDIKVKEEVVPEPVIMPEPEKVDIPVVDTPAIEVPTIDEVPIATPVVEPPKEPEVANEPVDTPTEPKVENTGTIADEKPIEDTLVVGEPVIETPGGDNSEEDSEVTKGVIAFKDLDILPESETWDGPGEEAKAEVADLKLICVWYNKAEPDNKASYKLPHHKADSHKAVWRGVAASMAALLGARGGVDIPEEDRKGVYNHLKKHYVQFEKDIPDFKMVEDQVLAKLSEEVQALTLDREDKHVVRLVKKVIKEQKEARYTSEQIRKALELLNLALSLYKKDSKKEVII